MQVVRDEVGLAQWVAWLRTRPPNLIVLEATGGLETLVVGRWWKRTCRRP
ncbi:MAG: hypothetical protein WBQ37_13680 [Candidatus Competibacter sp.]